MNSNLYVEQRIANEKKSAIVAYALWFFLGFFGVHRMYLGRWVSGFLMLALTGIGSLLTFILIGYLPLAFVAVWWVLDLFLISAMIQSDVRLMRNELSRYPGV